MISAEPNQIHVAASVLDRELAADGWGAWAELLIESASGPGVREGERIRVFVPPPLVAKIEKDARYDGSMTFRRGRGRDPGFFALVPP